LSLPNLDDPAVLREIDPQGMMSLIHAFPEQCEKAIEIASAYKPSKDMPRPRAIVVAGMGGSAIAGDMVGALLRSEIGCPWQTVRDYHLPNYLNGDTLVIAESYSGNTAETLSAYEESRDRGARVVCIKSGGKLAEMARRDGNDLIIIPAGQPPRSAAGYMLIPMLYVLERLGIASGWTQRLHGAISLVRSLRSRIEPGVPMDGNDAKMLARQLCGRIPLLYGPDGYIGVLCTRWKGQFNENSKVHAFSNVFPELNHNEILAWERADLQSDAFEVVILRDPEDAGPIADRIRITRTLIPKGYTVHDVPLEGENDLERLLWGIHFGDVVSGYLAILNRVDPMAMKAIELLKKEVEEAAKNRQSVIAK